MGRFFREIGVLSGEGGWIFWCLVVLGFGIAFALLSIWQFLQVAEEKMVGLANGGAAALVGTGGRVGSARLAGRFRELDERLFAQLGRRIPFAFVLIGAAPLVGLLGTVSGMFKTFDGMSGAALVAPVNIISSGVSEALITTQTGLIISVPTFIVCRVLQLRFGNLWIGFLRLVASLMQSFGGGGGKAGHVGNFEERGAR